jgi:hypothetical protein
VQHTPTILIFIGRKASTRTSASLVLGLELNRTHWTPRIFDGVCPQVEILRSRINPGINWNRTPQRFFIHPAHFQAITHDPAEIFPSKNKGSNIEGVPCHEF